MRRQPFQIQALDAVIRQAGQHLGLAAAGQAVQQDQLQRRGRLPVMQGGGHRPAPGLIAALQPRNGPADLLHHRGHGGRALPPAPAIDQGLKPAVAVAQRPFQMRGDVARHQGRAQATGEEFRGLDVEGSHLGPLGVVQHRQVDRAGQVVLGELARTAHVDDGVVAGERPQRHVRRQPRHQPPAFTTTAGSPSRTRPTRRAEAKPMS